MVIIVMIMMTMMLVMRAGVRMNMRIIMKMMVMVAVVRVVLVILMMIDGKLLPNRHRKHHSSDACLCPSLCRKHLQTVKASAAPTYESKAFIQ